MIESPEIELARLLPDDPADITFAVGMVGGAPWAIRMHQIGRAYGPVAKDIFRAAYDLKYRTPLGCCLACLPERTPIGSNLSPKIRKTLRGLL